MTKAKPRARAKVCETVLRVGVGDNPHAFSAGVVVIGDLVVETDSGIMRRMLGQSREKLDEYCAARGWRIEVVQETKR